MKAPLIIILALAASRLPAQTLEFAPWFSTEPLIRPADEMVVMNPQYAYEVRGSGYTLGGLSVQIYQAEHTVDLFDSSNPGVQAATRDNVIWDPHTKQALGWNFFSINF
jgi:hypothetical protein